jgi:rhodanese-related sulfurtransferase
MAQPIEAETLRDWLDAQQPVTVPDIRNDEDYEQWSIPGSLHLNAYEARVALVSGVSVQITGKSISRPLLSHGVRRWRRYARPISGSARPHLRVMWSTSE